MTTLTIADAYEELLDELNNVTYTIDKLYGYEACVDTELNDKNTKLFDRLHQALHCFGLSLEDQVIVEQKEGTIIILDDESDWRTADEDYEDYVEGFVDGDLDE